MRYPIDTDVADTSAAHLTETRRSTGTRDDLTVVWSTRPVRCSAHAPGHLTVEHDADHVPTVWDASGCGDWRVLVSRQCGCGEMVTVPAALRDGHLHGAALQRVAERVAAEADLIAARDHDEVRDRMTRWLSEASAQLCDAGVDLDDVTQDDLREHLWGLPVGDECEPGVWAPDDGRLEAWDYSVDGDVVVLTLDDLRR